MASGGDDVLACCFKDYCSKEGGMTGKEFTRMLTDAKVMKPSDNVYNSNNVDIAFTKAKTKGKNVITLAEFKKLIDALCEDKGKKSGKSADQCKEDLMGKLGSSSKSANLKAKVSKTGGVDRMTDTSKYTGSHKERFDESGKGKGMDGREERVANDGYVGNYKGKDTYGK